MAATTDSKLKQTADNIKQMSEKGISYTYDFDWFSVGMMGLIGVSIVVIRTSLLWYLNRKT